MDTAFVTGVLSVLIAALAGGLIARLFKLQPIVGYLLSGLVLGGFFAKEVSAERLAEIGVILLLFSVGIELSLERLSRVLKIATVGAIVQIVLTIGILYPILNRLGIASVPALILASGFSFSSTTVIVKILVDKGEMDTMHGEILIGWSLVQDLAVIPVMVLLPTLGASGGLMFFPAVKALLSAGFVVILALVLGRIVAPYVLHQVAEANSRELLILVAVFLAVGMAFIASFFGISPALGAFLAGVVVSESQENHAVFAEIRPLRDLFAALFFVSLGFLANLTVVFSHLWVILLVALIIILVKFILTFFLTLVLGYHGKTAVATGFGISQVGEFAFVLFSQGLTLKLLTPENASIGIAVALVTLLAAPFLFKMIDPTWKFIKDNFASKAPFSKFIFGWDKDLLEKENPMENHIIVCGYGRVGGWVGKVLAEIKVPFVVIEYDSNMVSKLKNNGINVIYGDPTHPEVLEAAGITLAKAVVVAIPDRVAQEELIAYVQTKAPDVKIISRVHQDEDWEKQRLMKVDKVVQPEFEAAVAISRAILSSMGKPKEEIGKIIKSLRISHAKIVK